MRLADLKPKQSAHVNYRGSGCFHNDNILIVFKGEDLRHPLIIAPDLPDVEAQAEISLDDLTGLDRLFEYWRQTQNERYPAGTSDSDVRVSWRSDETELDSEEFAHAFPPPGLDKEYARFVFGIMMGTVREREREVLEARRNAFSEWALGNHPLREIRFLDDLTVCALLKPDRSSGLDVRLLARTLSKACSEQTNTKRITCQIYDASKKLVSYTFKAREGKLLDRIDEKASLAVFGLVFGLIFSVGFAIWLLWWPVGRLRRLVSGSGKAA